MTIQKSTTLKGLLTAVMMLSFTYVSAQPTTYAGPQSVLIKNGLVKTITQGDLPNTDVYIVNGIIQGIGQELSAPANIPVIDATGKVVMPGIIDAHSHLNTVSTNEATSPVTAEITIKESIDPNDVAMYQALAGGVTTINLMHGSANVIGARNATLKLRYGADQFGLQFQEAPQTIKFALGENPTRVHGQGTGVQPRTRMGVERVIRDIFDDAIEYDRQRQDYLDQKEAHERRPNRVAPPVPVAKNLRLEVISDILKGNILVHCHSYRADEIVMLVNVFKEYGVENYTFQHANEAFKVAPELAEAGANASVFSDWWAYKFEVYYSTAYNAAILHENGVNTSINSDSNELIRHLNHEAAKVVRYGGISADDALAMITINPAKQLGIDDMVGSLEVGKHGDISIWSADPLSIYAVNEMTLVDGQVLFNRETDVADARLVRAISYDQSFEDLQSEVSEAVRGRQDDACMEDAFILFESGLQTEQTHNH